ncbi:molybdopterin dinucleotide binding domain-containing protein [Sporosarcina cascadiensis]|uniref:molybdopterin dinucleotide binding domain-containing protein n=1 Tax=Sporosarcina cascadiensis TaxID=2660747 RepID=UPI00129B4691|nr:molybdopterin dinucleotide binding domain-containing protein [Sporosarcina cascadiensis]
MDIIEGEIELPPHIGKTVQKGLVFVPFHFGNLDKKEAANELTIDFVDPLSKQPTFKQSACTVEKIRNVHEMDSEDTVESIAKQYGLTSSELLVANRKPSPYELQIERVEIPLSVINTPLQPYMPY